eukprot:gene22753-31042_t
MDILMDIGAQNNEISSAIRLKERVVIFLGLFLLGAVYLSCRSWSYIADLYVAVHFAKTNSMIAAVYCAIYPELISKGDAFLHYGMSWPFCIWLIANVLQTYSVYYDWTTVSVYIAVAQTLCFITISAATVRWLYLVTLRQSASRFHFNLLTLEEFTFFAYWFPALLYTPTAVFWKIATADLMWKNHTPENLMFQMCCHCFMGSPLNVVHAGLDIVRSEVQNNAGAPVVYISAETAAMIEDIFAASGTSIEILNDLLDYERIDSGTLKLELAWYPLPQFFEKNYSWAKMLAEKKGIKFTPSNGIIVMKFICEFQSDANNNAIISKGFMGFKSAGLGKGSTFFFQLPLYSSAAAGVDGLLLSAPTSMSTPLQDKGTPPITSDTMKGSMKRRNKVFVVEQDCEVSVIALSDDVVVPGAADRDRVDADDPAHPREEKSDEPKPLPPSAFLPVTPEHICRKRSCSNDTTMVDEFQHLPWGGESGSMKKDRSEEVKSAFYAVTTPISEEERTRFLLVDDSAMNRKVMARIIHSDSDGRFAVGVDLLEADDGGTAVEVLRSEINAGRRVDFVLMDFVMIKMNGPEAASIMRYSLQYDGPIIGVTGNALPDDIARFIANGASEVITKPLTKSKLLGAISRYKEL